MVTEIARRRFTVNDYRRMLDAGILGEDDRVELIRGEVVQMSPIGPPHNGTVHRAIRTLSKTVEDRAILGVQGSIRLDDYDEPQPDLYLLRPKEDFYTSAHAGPADILLIIEVADSSLDYDRTVKAQLYAESGVREYWISDIEHDCILIYTDAKDGSYRSVTERRRGETVTPVLLPGCSIPVEGLLP